MILKWLVMTVAVLIAGYILPGVTIGGIVPALVFAAILGIINLFVKPILVILTLPITILTLGLFLLIINALLVLLTATIVPGIAVTGFWWAVLFSIIVSLVSSFLQAGFEN